MRRLPVLTVLLLIAQLSLAHAGGRNGSPPGRALRWGRVAALGLAVCLGGCALHHETRTTVIRGQADSQPGPGDVERSRIILPDSRVQPDGRVLHPDGRIVQPAPRVVQPAPKLVPQESKVVPREDGRAVTREQGRAAAREQGRAVTAESPAIRHEHRTEMVDNVLGWGTEHRVVPDRGGRATYADYKLSSSAFRRSLEARRQILRDKGFFGRDELEEVELNITIVNALKKLDRADAQMEERYGGERDAR